VATVYEVECASAGVKAKIRIDDVIFPPTSDSWSGVGGARVWGNPNSGNVQWYDDFLFLNAGGATAGHQLFGFGKATKAGDQGDGLKYATGGSFPDGDFRWHCLSVS